MPIPSIVGNPLALGLGDALQGYLQGKGTAYQRQIGMMQAQGDFLKNQAMADYYTGRNQTNQNVADTRANGQIGAAMFRMNGLIYSTDQRTGYAAAIAPDDGRPLANYVTPFIQRAQDDRLGVDPWANPIPESSPISGGNSVSSAPLGSNYPTSTNSSQGALQGGSSSVPPAQGYSIAPPTGQGTTSISNGITYDPNSGTYFKNGFPTMTLR
jgi:hypothetical protein